MNYKNLNVFKAFDAALSVEIALMEILLAEGIGDARTARPYAVEWATQVREGGKLRYPASQFKPREKGEGHKLVPVYGSGAERAITRVLEVIFPDPAKPKGGKPKKATDKVAELAKKFQKLNAAQQRRFLKLIEE